MTTIQQALLMTGGWVEPSWELMTVPAGITRDPVVGVSPTRFVISGRNSSTANRFIYYSDSGSSWAAASAPTSILYDTGSGAVWHPAAERFVFYLNSNTTWISTDGATFSSNGLKSNLSQPQFPYYDTVNNVVGQVGVFGSGGTQYSSNGTTFSNGITPNALQGGFCYDRWVFLGANFVNYTFNLATAVSAGVCTWTTFPTPSLVHQFIGKQGAYIVWPADSGTTYYFSADGVNWTTATRPTSLRYGSIICVDGVFLTSRANTPYLSISRDGLNWTNGVNPLPWTPNSSEGIIFAYRASDKRYIAFRANEAVTAGAVSV